MRYLILLMLSFRLASSSVATQESDDQHAFDGVPILTLQTLPAIELTSADEVPGTVHDTFRFTLAGESKIVFLRGDDRNEVLVVIDTNGNLLGEIALPDLTCGVGPFPPMTYSYWQDLIWLGDDRVLLWASPFGELRKEWPWFFPPTPTLWLARLRDGIVIPLGYAPADPMRGVASTRDGGFVIGTNNEGHGQLLSYDARCRLRWSLKAAHRLANLDDLCVTSNGLIAVLDAAGEPGVQFVYPEGRVGPYVKLARRWKLVGKPGWILASSDGGLYVWHWFEEQAIVRCGPNVNLRGRMSPRHPDGQPIEGTWRASPSGRLWCTDGYAFFLVGDNGEIDQIVGEARDCKNLRRANLVRIGPDDRIYAVSARDKSLHVFDDSGGSVRVVRSDAPDDPELPYFKSLSHEFAGEESWPQPRSGHRWLRVDGEIRIVDLAGQTLRRFTAESVGTSTEGYLYLENVTPDGGVCLGLRTSSDVAVILLDADGSIATQWVLPDGLRPMSISSDGRRCAVAFVDQVVVFDRVGEPAFRMRVEPAYSGMCGLMPDTTWKVHLARDGTELWLRRGVAATRIERYRMP
jgi:hypothetical protein